MNFAQSARKASSDDFGLTDFGTYPSDSCLTRKVSKKGSAHQTEKIVRLGLPRIIRLKENAPELVICESTTEEAGFRRSHFGCFRTARDK
jgi:hypothetical protein